MQNLDTTAPMESFGGGVSNSLQSRDEFPGFGVDPGTLLEALEQIPGVFYFVNVSQFRIMAISRKSVARLGFAVNELIHSDQGIAGIALRLVFSDQSAFTHKFRAVTGLPPGVYHDRYVAKLSE